VVDILTGQVATSAILAALYQRTQTGSGQHIDIALLDVQVAMLANQASNYLLGGQVPQRLGSAHPSIVPYQPFACADGHLMLAIGNDSQFANFCAAANLPHLSMDARYATNAARVTHRSDLAAQLQAVIQQKTLDDWIALGQQHNFPCGPINTLDRVFADPQVQARAMQRPLSSTHYGTLNLVANPINMSASPTTSTLPPPALGAHTRDILAQLGLDEASIAALREQHII